MEKIKAGIIGCGGIATLKHLPSMRETGLVEIIGFCDLIESRAQDSKNKYGADGARVYTDYKDLLKDKEISVVYVCTANLTHSLITVDALRAGKHVMCEKPMAINAQDAKKMLDASKETGKVLTIGYQYRYGPEYLYVKNFAQNGGLGDIYFARALALRRRGVPNWGVFLDKEQQGGGPLIDIGTHALDMTLWTMDNYRPKYAVGTVYHKLNKDTEQGNIFGDWDPAEFTVEDSAFGFVVMENGATIILESSWALNDRHTKEAAFTMSGTKAGVDFFDGLHINSILNGNQTDTKVDLDNGGGITFTVEGLKDKPEVMEQKIFLNAVLGKGELTVLPEQAYIVTLILDAIYESGRTGKPVYFDL